jgi:nitrate/nitrite transporter NarK
MRATESKLDRIVRERIGSRKADLSRLDPTKDHISRTNQIRLCSCKRPYARAFHFAWLSFFCAFMGWFALGPAVPDLIASGVVSQEEVNVSSTWNLVGTIVLRFMLGPMVEEWGPRRVQAGIMAVGGAVVCLTGAVQSGAGLSAIRFFIGCIGGAFVPTQFWIAMMYSGEVVGTMAGTAAGFGNTGAGVVVFVVGGIIDAMAAAGVGPDTRWRVSQLLPGALMLLVALPVWYLTDDCPQGHWDSRQYGTIRDRVALMFWARRASATSLQDFLVVEKQADAASHNLWARLRLAYLTSPRAQAFFDRSAWVVGLQYAVASGVELSIITGLTSFYRYEFGCGGDAAMQVRAMTNATVAQQYVRVAPPLGRRALQS